MAVRRHAVEASLRYAEIAGLTTCSEEELHVRMHVIDVLADAIARGEFIQLGVTDETARKELVAQWKACFVQPGAAMGVQSR